MACNINYTPIGKTEPITLTEAEFIVYLATPDENGETEYQRLLNAGIDLPKIISPKSTKKEAEPNQEGEKREKSVLNKFMNSSAGSKFKNDIETLGLEYVIKDQAAANEYAQYLYNNLGFADALIEATYNDVKTLVYGAAIDDLSKKIETATGEELADLEAERKKVVDNFDEYARDLGRGVAAIGYWYMNNASAIEFMLKRQIENQAKEILSPKGQKANETIQHKLDQVSKELAELKASASSEAAARAAAKAEKDSSISIEKEITKKGGIGKNATEAKKKQVRDFMSQFLVDESKPLSNKTFMAIIPVNVIINPKNYNKFINGITKLLEKGIDLNLAISEVSKEMLETTKDFSTKEMDSIRNLFNKKRRESVAPRNKSELQKEREAANKDYQKTKQKYRELEKELKEAENKEKSAQKAEADAIQKVLDNVDRENFKRIVNEQKELKAKREKLEEERIKDKQDLEARLLKLEERKEKAEQAAKQKAADSIERENFKRIVNEQKELKEKREKAEAEAIKNKKDLDSKLLKLQEKKEKMEADAIQKMADNVERENFKRAQNQASEAVRLANEVRDKKKQIAKEVLRDEMTPTEYKQFIEELLLSSDEIQAKSKQDFIDKLTAKLKEYNIKDASKYVEAFVAERDAIINEKAQQILDRTFKGIKDKLSGTFFPSRKKIETQRIMEAIMYGALQDEDYAKLFYEKYGIVDANDPQVAEKLKELTEMYKNATTPFYKEMVLARAAGYIGYIKAKNKNLGFWLNYFYNNILFHYDTTFKMIKFNVTAKLGGTAMLMAKNPYNAMYFAKKMFTKSGLNFSRSLAMAEAAMRDKVNMKFDLKDNDAILNLKDYEGNKFKRFAQSFNRMASRILGGGDALFSTVAAEAKLSELLFNEFSKELKAKGIKLSKKETQALINDIMGHDSVIVDAVNEQSIKDALAYYNKNSYEELTANEKNDVKLNTLYTLNKRMITRGAELATEFDLANINAQSIMMDKERADKWAKTSVMYGRPEGTVGLIADVIGTVGEGLPWSKPFFATIINAPLNMLNLYINGSPLGIARLALNLSRSKRGIFLSDAYIKKHGLEAGVNITPDQKKEMVIRVATAQLLTIAICALQGAFDDDDDLEEEWKKGTWRDRKLYITADLTGDYKKNETLKKTEGGAGLEEYSVYAYGRKVWDYKDDFSGIFFLQSGIYMDARRSGRINKDRSWSDKLLAAQLLEIEALKDISSLKSVAETIDVAFGGGKYKGEELTITQRMKDHWETSMAKTITAGGFPAGRMWQSAIEDYRGLTSQDKKEPYGVLDKLKGMVALQDDLRTKTDFFGRPIKERFKVASPLATNFVRQTPTSEFLLGWQRAKLSDPLFTLLADHDFNEIKHKLRTNQAMTDLGKYGIGKIDLTQRQIDEINEARGKALLTFLSDPTNFEAMQILDDKDFATVATLVLNTANRNAFQKVVEGKTTNTLSTGYIDSQEQADLKEIDTKMKKAKEDVIAEQKRIQRNKITQEELDFSKKVGKGDWDRRKDYFILELQNSISVESQIRRWTKGSGGTDDITVTEAEDLRKQLKK